MSETKPKMSMVAPFTVEADHPKNSDLLVQSLTGVCNRRLRSALKSSIPVHGRRGKKTVKAPTLKGEILPEVVGMYLQVNPADLEITISDPLADNVTQQEDLKRYIKQTRGTSENMTFIETTTHKLNEHRMKTLCEEILLFIGAGEMKLVEGPKYTQDDVDSLPGRYLQNPGSLVRSGQPMFRDQMEEYENKLLNAGL